VTALPAHRIDAKDLRAKLKNSRAYVDQISMALPRRPDLLLMLGVEGQRIAGGALATAGPKTAAKAGAEALEALQRGARAAAAALLLAGRGPGTTSFEWSPGLRVDVTGALAPSLANAGAYVDAMWQALACAEWTALEMLATVDFSHLRSADVQHGRYLWTTAAFLRSLVLRDGRHGEHLAQAMADALADDDAAAAATAEWVQGIEFPALRCAFHALEGDGPGFDAALQELHDGHRAHWSSESERLALEGLLSVRGCAVRRLAKELGVAVGVDSAYVPVAVYAAARVDTALRCPYCAGPLPAGAAACAMCGEAVNDAPLELDWAGRHQAAQVACTHCDFPMQALAVRCPRCRTRRALHA
jgi:hypothetical protein